MALLWKSSGTHLTNDFPIGLWWHRSRRQLCNPQHYGVLSNLAPSSSAVIREQAAPMQKIGDVKIVDVRGFQGLAPQGTEGATDGGGVGNGSIGNDLVNALLKYKIHAPIAQNILSEVGLTSETEDGLISGDDLMGRIGNGKHS